MRGIVALTGWTMTTVGAGLFDYRYGMLAGGAMLLGAVLHSYRGTVR